MMNSTNVPKSPHGAWQYVKEDYRGLVIYFVFLLKLLPKDHWIRKWKRSAGRPKTTWLSLILNNISKYSNINLSGEQEKDLESLEKIYDDIKAWLKTVDCIMSSKKTKMQWWWWCRCMNNRVRLIKMKVLDK